VASADFVAWREGQEAQLKRGMPSSAPDQVSQRRMSSLLISRFRRAAAVCSGMRPPRHQPPMTRSNACAGEQSAMAATSRCRFRGPLQARFARAARVGAPQVRARPPRVPRRATAPPRPPPARRLASIPAARGCAGRRRRCAASLLGRTAQRHQLRAVTRRTASFRPAASGSTPHLALSPDARLHLPPTPRAPRPCAPPDLPPHAPSRRRLPCRVSAPLPDAVR